MICSDKCLRGNMVAKLDAFNPIGDPKSQVEPAEMSLHCTWSDVEAFADFCVVTSKKQELDDVPLARSQLNGLYLKPTVHITS
jgi:hypothetical protein